MTTRVQKKIPHPEFALRMQQACDGNNNVPPPNYGRLGWFRTQLEDRFGMEVTVETVRKWFAGEARPREKPMAYLSNILGVDEAWLALGSEPEIAQKQQKVRNASADGVVNVIAGLIAMGGGNPAFPLSTDKRARDEKIDLYAVIRGAQYAFHICLGEKKDDQWHFIVPVDAMNTLVLGVMPNGMSFDVIELDPAGIEKTGVRKGGIVHVTVPTDEHTFRPIESFAERL